MRRIILAPLMVSMLLLMAADIALGCRCPGLSEATTPGLSGEALVKEFNNALAVFSGEVIEQDQLKVKFKVDKLWKGNFRDEITMSTGAKDKGNGLFDSVSSCDYSFRLGEKYLVFAYGRSAKEMKAHKCGGTRYLKYAEQEMKNLDKVRAHKKINLRSIKETSLSSQAKSNNSFNRSGISMFFIENLDAARQFFPPG